MAGTQKLTGQTEKAEFHPMMKVISVRNLWTMPVHA